MSSIMWGTKNKHVWVLDSNMNNKERQNFVRYLKWILEGNKIIKTDFVFNINSILSPNLVRI